MTFVQMMPHLVVSTALTQNVNAKTKKSIAWTQSIAAESLKRTASMIGGDKNPAVMVKVAAQLIHAPTC